MLEIQIDVREKFAHQKKIYRNIFNRTTIITLTIDENYLSVPLDYNIAKFSIIVVLKQFYSYLIWILIVILYVPTYKYFLYIFRIRK